MYDIRGDLLSVWDPTPNRNDDVTTQPHGIAVTSRGEIVVTDTERNGINVLSSEGRSLRNFGTKGDLLQQFHLPFFCAVDRRDQILVSDNMNYCVKIFDTQVLQ